MLSSVFRFTSKRKNFVDGRLFCVHKSSWTNYSTTASARSPPEASPTPPPPPSAVMKALTSTMKKFPLLLERVSAIFANPIVGQEEEESDVDDDYEPLEINDKDLESDESLWNLYERWYSVQRLSRSPDEKQRRFENFKNDARWIHDHNKLYEMGRPGYSHRLVLNHFADWDEAEMNQMRGAGCPMKVGIPEPPEAKHTREFIIEDKDVESEESLWNLYERWCSAKGTPRRSLYEKQRHFKSFKGSALSVYKHNRGFKMGKFKNRVELDYYADWIWDEDGLNRALKMGKLKTRPPYRVSNRSRPRKPVVFEHVMGVEKCRKMPMMNHAK